MSEYLTTSEVAELLRIKERKVYDLASSGELPCNKAIGKLLFPRNQIEAWLAQHAEHVVEPLTSRPAVFLGSHDPLLEWALRESRSGLAMLFDGSADGITRFKNREGIAAGVHIHDHKSETWNTHAVQQHCAQNSVVLVEWALRSRGLVVSPNVQANVTGMKDLLNLRFVPRQPEAGAQVLFTQLLNQNNIDIEQLDLVDIARSETDIAQAISSGNADVGFGLESVAASYNLMFVPIVQERFDLLIDRKHYFEEPLQRLWQFCLTDRFKQHAASITGYDASNIGQVRFNSATQAR